MSPPYIYSAEIVSVYDGDTMDALVDLGFHTQVVIKVRLYGVNAPEIRGEEKETGIMVRDFVRSLVLNKKVTIKTYKDPTDKYGRWLAEVQGNFGDGMPQNLSSLLLIKGYAVPFMV